LKGGDLRLEKLWTEIQTGEYLNIAVGTLQQWRYSKIGPPWLKLPTGAVRYKPEAVAAWAESNTTVPKTGTFENVDYCG
jgi:hypothetical protein